MEKWCIQVLCKDPLGIIIVDDIFEYVACTFYYNVLVDEQVIKERDNNVEQVLSLLFKTLCASYQLHRVDTSAVSTCCSCKKSLQGQPSLNDNDERVRLGLNLRIHSSRIEDNLNKWKTTESRKCLDLIGTIKRICYECISNRNSRLLMSILLLFAK